MACRTLHFPHLMRKVHPGLPSLLPVIVYVLLTNTYSKANPRCVRTHTHPHTHTPTLQLWTFSVTQLALTLRRGVAVLLRCRQVAAMARLPPSRLTYWLTGRVSHGEGGGGGNHLPAVPDTSSSFPPRVPFPPSPV